MPLVPAAVRLPLAALSVESTSVTYGNSIPALGLGVPLGPLAPDPDPDPDHCQRREAGHQFTVSGGDVASVDCGQSLAGVRA